MKLGRAPTMFMTFMIKSFSTLSSALGDWHGETSPWNDVGCGPAYRAGGRIAAGSPSGFQAGGADQGRPERSSGGVVYGRKGVCGRRDAAVYAEVDAGTRGNAREGGPGGRRCRSEGERSLLRCAADPQGWSDGG